LAEIIKNFIKQQTQ